MNLSYLRKVRIIVSLLFFLLMVVVYLDLSNSLAEFLSGYLTYLQFIPSLMKLTTIFGLGSAGVLIVSLLTVFFGRFYCSTVCPLGTLQDIVSYISRKINKKKYYKPQKNYKILKYTLLIISFIPLLWGNLLILNLLDPFSNSGRIFSDVFKPGAVFLNNISASILKQFNLFILYPVELKSFAVFSFIFSFTLLFLVSYLSYRNGRIFCNTICPVGTLLSIFSKFSLFKIQVDKNLCSTCSLCERVCKAGCIDKKAKEINYENCVNCYNCLDVCPGNGISFKPAYKKKFLDEQIDLKKRDFITKTFLYIISLSSLSFSQIKIIPKKESTKPVIKKNTVSPPGTKSFELFNAKCTACHLCVSSCPTQVLKPSFLEYGFFGMLQPFMNYNISYCNYECVVCGDVCPSGAILPSKPEDKKLIQLGKSIFVKENCIVETEGTECGACAERCPTKAVKMIPYKKLHLPELNNDYCVGCGACEFACPTKPYKAIYVEGNPIHLTAKKPPEEKLEQQKIDLKEEFPF